MDAFVKFQSQESSFETPNSVVKIAGATTSKVSNIASFSLPQNSGAYDLSQSYVSVHLKATPDYPAGATPATDVNPVADVAIDFKEVLTATSAQRTGTPGVFLNSVVSSPAVIVKNAKMSSAKGQVESIRNVAALRSNLAFYEKTEAQYNKRIGGLNNASYPYTSSRQPVNPLNNVGVFKSENRVHEIQVPLSEIYNVGKQESWSTDYYGQTDMVMELNLDQLVAKDAQATRNVLNSVIPAPSGAGFKYGDMIDATNGTAADVPIGGSEVPLISKNKYQNPDEIPYFVGQRVTVTGAIKAGSPGGGTAAVAVIAQIKEVRYLDDAAGFYAGATAGNCEGQVAIFLETGVGVMKTGANSVFEAIQILHQQPTDIALSVNKVELVAKKTNVNNKSALQYTTYLSQEDSAISSASIQRSYNLPPNTMNCVVLFPNPVFSSEPLSSYRIQIDGENLSTRDIVYKTGLHYDLLTRYFSNRGMVLENIREKIETNTKNRTDTLVGGDAENITMIAFPVPLKPQNSILTLELEGTAALSGKISIYSEIVKQL